MKYPVVLHTDDGESYGVMVPDIEGCFSAGDSIEDAMANVKEAIEGHLEILAEDEMTIPEAGRIADHQNNPDYEGGIWALVDVDVTPFLGKSERINITLPILLLRKIDKLVESDPAHRTRSGFLQEIARAKLRSMG